MMLNDENKNQLVDEILAVVFSDEDASEITSDIIEIVDKWTPKKLLPIAERTAYNKFGMCRVKVTQHRCPTCNSVLSAGPNYQPNNCSECGQPLSFEGIDLDPHEEFLYYVNPEHAYEDD